MKKPKKKPPSPRSLDDKELARATGGRAGWGDGNASYACDDWEAPVV